MHSRRRRWEIAGPALQAGQTGFANGIFAVAPAYMQCIIEVCESYFAMPKNV